MYSLLLVDDEKLILEALKSVFDWGKMGVAKIETARNGKEALEKVEWLQPDIIITDVKMPVMNGIDFTNRLRKQRKSSKIIFLSGYDEFDYVKEALAVNAAEYLLKPVNIDELKKVINKVLDQCEQDKLAVQSSAALLEKYIFKLLFEENEQTQIEICNWIQQINRSIDINDECYSLLLIKIIKSSTLSRSQSNIILNLIKQKLSKERIKNFIIEALKDEFVILLNQNSDKLFVEYRFCEELQKLIHDSQHVSVTCCLPGRTTSLPKIGSLYYEALQLLEYRFYLGNRAIIDYASITGKQNNPNHQRTKQILDFIHENYHQDISIYDIADKLYLSPNYLRAIFKEETGETLLFYLTRLRIDKAAEYLRDPSLKIREVSNKVGYQNVSYFCSLFYKTKGMTPNEFRKSAL